MARTAAFVVNRTRVRAWPQVSDYCRAAAAAGGWDPLLLETTVDDAGTGLTRRAAAAGASLVFAMGGDGTVRACAQALAGTPIPLAIVPRGTANLTARALGVPAGLEDALGVGFGSHERRIDLAVADGITYAAMAGIGVDAAVVGATPGRLKARAGWLAYAAAGTRHALACASAFELRLDGAAPLSRQARSVVVGNACAARGIHAAARRPAGRRPARRGDPGAFVPPGLGAGGLPDHGRHRARGPAAGTAPGTPRRDPRRQ